MLASECTPRERAEGYRKERERDVSARVTATMTTVTYYRSHKLST